MVSLVRAGYRGVGGQGVVDPGATANQSSVFRSRGPVSTNHRPVLPGIGHQVCLELVQIHIESSLKSEACRDGGDYLGNQAVEVGVGRPRYLEISPRQNIDPGDCDLYLHIAPGNVVDGLVVHQEGTVAVLQGGVGVQDGVVGLHYGC